MLTVAILDNMTSPELLSPLLAATPIADGANVAKEAFNRSATTLQFWTDRVANFIDAHGSAILGALMVLIAGFLISRKIVKVFSKWLDTKPIEPPLRLLLCRIAQVALMALALMIALQTAGVAITPLLTGIGVAGVGVSLASQGVLSNVVGGLVIIFTKPFRVGEYVEVIGVEGKVESVELMTTTLSHADRSLIRIPNRKLIGEVVHNYGTVRQLNLVATVAYGTNLPDAFAAIWESLRGNSHIIKDLTPVVAITELGDSAINIAVKPWVSIGEMGVATDEIYQAILKKFDERKIEVPFPQQEIRILNLPKSGAA